MGAGSRPWFAAPTSTHWPGSAIAFAIASAFASPVAIAIVIAIA